MKNQNYLAIRAWGKMMGSFDYYIDRQIGFAQADKAPELAIYKRENDWQTLDQVKNEETKRYFSMNYPDLAKKAGFIN